MLTQETIDHGLELLRAAEVAAALGVPLITRVAAVPGQPGHLIPDGDYTAEMEGNHVALVADGRFLRWPGSGGWWPLLGGPRVDPRDSARLLIDSRSPVSGREIEVALPPEVEVLEPRVARMAPAQAKPRPLPVVPTCACREEIEPPRVPIQGRRGRRR